jgi:lysophospholipase L1-like esterase
MVGPPPVADETHNESIQALSQIFAEASKMLAVPYIDLFFPLVTDPIYCQDVLNNDGSHPQKRGYEKMAQIIHSSPNWWFHKV